MAEAGNPSVDFISVCTPAEYKEKHIVGVRNLPLAELSARWGELKEKNTVYVQCRTGKRSTQAIEEMKKLGVTAELVSVKGGLTAWDEAGFPTRSLTTRLPIMRQVFLVVGSLIVVGTVLTFTVDVRFMVVPGLIGAGLIFAGLTGWCGLTYLLARMPWNR